MSNFHGMKIVVAPSLPRYILPKSLFDGHVWPDGFRDEFNAWSVRALGTTSLIKDGQVLVISGSALTMNPKTFNDLKRCGVLAS